MHKILISVGRFVVAFGTNEPWASEGNPKQVHRSFGTNLGQRKGAAANDRIGAQGGKALCNGYAAWRHESDDLPFGSKAKAAMLSPGMALVDVASQLSQGIGKVAGPQVSDGSTVIVTNSMLLLSDNGNRTRYSIRNLDKGQDQDQDVIIVHYSI